MAKKSAIDKNKKRKLFKCREYEYVWTTMVLEDNESIKARENGSKKNVSSR
jgi:hypothetical protein